MQRWELEPSRVVITPDRIIVWLTMGSGPWGQDSGPKPGILLAQIGIWGPFGPVWVPFHAFSCHLRLFRAQMGFELMKWARTITNRFQIHEICPKPPQLSTNWPPLWILARSLKKWCKDGSLNPLE